MTTKVYTVHSILSLIGLALLDSLSIGTLVIPLALILMWRNVRVPALAAYLLTVAAVYFALGVAMLLGFTGLGSYVERITDTPVFPWITLVPVSYTHLTLPTNREV